MTAETIFFIICAVLCGICYFGIKWSEKHTYLKYKDQKAGGSK